MASNDPDVEISIYSDDIVIQSEDTQLAGQIANELQQAFEERQTQLQQRRQRWLVEQQQAQEQLQQQQQSALTAQAVYSCALMVLENNPATSVDLRLNEVYARLQRDGVQFNRDRHESELRHLLAGELRDAYEFVFVFGRRVSSSQ